MPVRELTLEESLVRFVDYWRQHLSAGLSERAASQSFLRDLLDRYGVERLPGQIFEQHPIAVSEPSQQQPELFGPAPAPKKSLKAMDLYLPELCVWEMKGPKEDLAKHHTQLLNYWAVMQTRYMVLCNFREFWVYDTSVKGGQLAPAHTFTLEELPANASALLFLRGEEAHYSHRAETVTRDVAKYIGAVVRALIERSSEPEADRDRITKFALECVFAMFAEDAELIPHGIFTAALHKAQQIGEASPVYALFMDFDQREARDKTNPAAPYINGPLYDSRPPRFAMDKALLSALHTVASDNDWREVRPEIFGSIYEQALAKDVRHALGAHYTSHADIMRIVGPTVVRPWQERIKACKTHKDAEALIERLRCYHILDPACGCGNFLYIAYREMKRLEAELRRKHQELYKHKVAKRANDMIPPPPGPYFTVQQLHGIDKQEWAVTLTRVVLWIGEHLANRELSLGESTLPLKDLSANIVFADALLAEPGGLAPRDGSGGPRAAAGRAAVSGRSEDVGAALVRPANDAVAAAPVLPAESRAKHGFAPTKSGHGRPCSGEPGLHLRAAWFRPPDDGRSELAIIGNPPFMGSKKMRMTLGDDYVDKLHAAYPENRMADLVSYWYPQALSTLRPGERTGFVSTNSIAQNESREASLDKLIAAGGTIHDAWKSYPWPGEAAVHVSIINWLMQGDYRGSITLDDKPVIGTISPSLSSSTDVAGVRQIIGNSGLSYQGVIPGNEEFLLQRDVAERLIADDPLSESVIKPFLVGADLNRSITQSPSRYIIDFGFMEFERIKQYRSAFLYAQQHIQPIRAAALDRKSDILRDHWWQMVRPRSEMRDALAELSDYLAISRVSPQVAFARVSTKVLPDNAVFIITLSSYYHFGILQSRIHEIWAWARGSTLKGDLRYTNTTIFETFPFPLHPKTWAKARHVQGLPGPRDLYEPREAPDTREARRVEAVARELYEKRQAACRSLNLGLTKLYNLIKGKTPLPGNGRAAVSGRSGELIKSGCGGPPSGELIKSGRGGPPSGEPGGHGGPAPPDMATIILELRRLHEELNAAVCACYGWPADAWRDDNEVLRRLLELNQALTSG